MIKKSRNNFIRLKAPLKITFNITNRCNFNCVHCYNDSCASGKDDELSLLEIKAILADFKKLDVPLISINGGEPLLRSDIFEVLKEAAKLGFGINLNTNGSLITKEVAKKLSILKIKNIDVSLHASNSPEFTKFTKTHLFNCVIDGIKNLIEVGITPSIAFSITSVNVDWLPSVVKIAKKLGINTIHTIVLIERGRAINNNLTVGLDHLKKVYNLAIKAGKKNGVSLFLDCPFNLHEEYYHNDCVEMDRGCFGGRYIACIQSNGDVTPCALFPEYVVGNIRKKRFIDLWDSPRMPVLGMERYHLPGMCKDCNKLSDCRGGCPTSNYSPNGYKPDALCIKTKK